MHCPASTLVLVPLAVKATRMCSRPDTATMTCDGIILLTERDGPNACLTTSLLGCIAVVSHSTALTWPSAALSKKLAGLNAKKLIGSQHSMGQAPGRCPTLRHLSLDFTVTKDTHSRILTRHRTVDLYVGIDSS